MPWIQFKISSTNSIAPFLGDRLTELGALSITFQDSCDEPISEPVPGNIQFWSQTTVIGLFAADQAMDTIIEQLIHSQLININTPYQLIALEDKDWSREWMKNFAPVAFGQRLWICPSWCPIPDAAKIHVVLDPGLAFGTGAHPTTALCLRWLDSLDLNDKTVIDYGCGSGILAIAALKLGARQAIAIDIDPQARLATLENGHRNEVQNRLKFYFPDQITASIQADIVVANILARPLHTLAAQISACVKPNGLLALSGLLDWQASQICAVYQNNFTLDPIEFDAEWCRITGRKMIS